METPNRKMAPLPEPDITHLDLTNKIDVGMRTSWGKYSDIYEGWLNAVTGKVMIAVKEFRVSLYKPPQSDSSASTIRAPYMTWDERLKRRFFREVLLWQTLRHPHIVPLLGFMIRDGFPSLISPWYKHGSVVRYLRVHPNPNRASLALDTSRGLKYLHTIPITHGALTGENVLVDSSNRASLCDFGMSELMDEAVRTIQSSPNWLDGAIFRYTCPELLDGKPKSTAADIWALGCLVVQILTGQIPYDRIKPEHAIPVAIVTGELPVMNADKSVDKSLWHNLARCWRMAPEGRPTASDVELWLECYHKKQSSASRALKTFLPSVDLLIQETGRVMCLEFSPDGMFLAAGLSEETVDGRQLNIWKCEPGGLIPYSTHRGDVQSVAWSAQDNKLLIQFKNRIEIRSHTDKFESVVTYPRTNGNDDQVTASAWLRDGDAFAYAKDHEVTIQNVTEPYRTISFSVTASVRGLTFTPDGQRMTVVGINDDIEFGLYSYKVSDRGTMKLDCRASLWHEPIGVTMGSVSRDVLVTYGQSPPQLWRIEMPHKGVTLARTYKTSDYANDLWKSVRFGGIGDLLVIGLTRGGDIHFWDSESGGHLHSIHSSGINFTHLSWNYGIAEASVFATTGSDTSVTIWSTHNDEVELMQHPPQSEGLDAQSMQASQQNTLLQIHMDEEASDDALESLKTLDLEGKVAIGQQVTGGGFSDVFQGTLLRDGIEIKVAIKTLRFHGAIGLMTTERLVKRFHREVLLWKRLQHPNTVPLLGYTMPLDSSPTMVSPWYSGGNVVGYLRSCLNPDRRAIALDVVKGLEYLHSIPIIHGDLKGENVLVDADGRASLCDFGMSQFVEETSSITGYTTSTAGAGGTPGFMSPELYKNLPKTTATDMWAIACLVIQIFTGETPYHYITRPYAILWAVLQGQLPWESFECEIDTALLGCVKKCWSFTPEGRPGISDLKMQFLTPENDVMDSSEPFMDSRTETKDT